MTLLTANWTPLSGASHAVALDVLINGPLSRAELARRLDLSAGSLTRLARPLVDAGLLVEVEPHNGDARQGDARLGRPEKPLDVVPTSHHFIGIKLTGDTAYGVLTTLRAETVAAQDLPLTDPAPQAVCAVIAELVARLSAHGPTVTAVGISIGGQAPDHATVLAAPFLHWLDVPLAAMVEELTGLPVVVENDVIALTEAEHWFGAGRGLGRFAVITIGAGVGFSLVIRGHLSRGLDAGLGLVGHVPLDPAGPMCFAGHRGCSTAMLTMPSIAAAASVALRRPVDYDDVLDLAIAGDPAAGRIVADAGRALGRLIALAANLTMPERVVLSGEGIRLVDVAREDIAAALAADRDPAASPVDFDVRPGDFTQWARGAAVIAIQTYVLGTD
ncbi:MAG: ROK family protein [Cellulomonas sp.]